MSSKTKPTALAVAALAGGLALSGSAFAMQPLAQGYMLASAGVAEGSCGGKSSEGSCGAEHKAKTADGKAAEGKCGEGKCGMDKMDTDKDGRISRAEFAAAHDNDDSKFAAHDTDKDGFISAAEMKAHKGGAGGKAMEEGKCGEGKCGAA